MRNYFVCANYYQRGDSKPAHCDSMLLTDYRDCVSAWESATFCFSRHRDANGYAKFVITEFKEIK